MKKELKSGILSADKSADDRPTVGRLSFWLMLSRFKSWINSKFDQIQPCTAEIAALDRLKIFFTTLEVFKIFCDMLALR